MASITLDYREKRIHIITARNSATSQFTHNHRVYQQKMTNLRGAGTHPIASKQVVKELFTKACQQVDKVLGPLRADHLLKT